jgi:hypothetical protein
VAFLAIAAPSGIADQGARALGDAGCAIGTVSRVSVRSFAWARQCRSREPGADLSEAAEAKLERGERLTLEEWKSGDRLWLVELISPFATPENKLSEAMLADLMQGPFRTRAFSLHRTDPASGRRDKVTIRSHVAGAAPEPGPTIQ